jgi:hypothetical protein
MVTAALGLGSAERGVGVLVECGRKRRDAMGGEGRGG